MITLGLTGVLGSGKSTVAQLLQEHGLDVIDLDALAKASLNSKEIQAELKATFGEECVAGGHVNAAKLSALVFDQRDELRKLEAIVHPRVRAEVKKKTEKLAEAGARAVVLDHPLLFESGFYKKVDKIIVVAADSEIIKERLKKRGMRDDDIERRLSIQIPLDQKTAEADYVINNNGTEAELKREVDSFLEKLAHWEEKSNASH